MSERDALLLRVKYANPVPGSLPLPETLADSRPPLALLIDNVSSATDTTLDELEAQTDPVGRRWRRAVVVAVAALVAAVVVALPLLLIGGSDDAPIAPSSTVTTSTVALEETTTSTAGTESTTTSATSTTSTPTTTSTPPLPDELALTWRQVPTAAFEGGWISAVVEGGPGVVAVGGARTEGVGPSPTGESFHSAGVWVSADGAEWERITDASFVGAPDGEGYESVYMSDVAAGSPGLAAVGFDGRGAVWFSADGVSWRRVPHDDAVFGSNGAELEKIVWTGSRFVAVGFMVLDDGRSEVVSWVSADGETWTRGSALGPVEMFANDPLGFGDPRIDLAAWNDAAVVVGSVHLGEEWTYRPAVWVSDDGLLWQLIPDEGGGSIETIADDAGSAMTSVIAAGDRLVALGWTGDIPFTGRQRPVIWGSTDGRTWDLAASTIHGDDALWGATAIGSAGPRLVFAVGDENDGSVFGSVDDGDSWHPVGSLDGEWRGAEAAATGADQILWTVNDVTSIGDAFVVVGRVLSWSNVDDLGARCSWDPGDGSAGSCRTDAAVWIGTWTER